MPDDGEGLSEIEKLKAELAAANARAKAAEDTAAELAGFHNEEAKVRQWVPGLLFSPLGLDRSSPQLVGQTAL